jgi:hypothetical protein
MGLEVAHGGGLVLVHEPTVARDIGGKNGSEPALDRGLFVHDVFSALAQASRWVVLHIALRIARTVPINDDERNKLCERYRWEVVGPKPP